MKNEIYIPNIVDFAHEVIAMEEEIIFLRQKLADYKSLNDLNIKDLKRQEIHTSEITSIIINAVIDPESVINKGNAAILELEIKKENSLWLINTKIITKWFFKQHGKLIKNQGLTLKTW